MGPRQLPTTRAFGLNLLRTGRVEYAGASRAQGAEERDAFAASHGGDCDRLACTAHRGRTCILDPGTKEPEGYKEVLEAH
jgi:hypothetical protein